MPVEILEIVVRANIQEPATANSSGQGGNAGEDENFKRQQIIEECVEQVLEILRRKQER